VDMLKAAAEQFLDKSIQEIQAIALETLVRLEYTIIPLFCVKLFTIAECLFLYLGRSPACYYGNNVS
jgi:hypothetical protein